MTLPGQSTVAFGGIGHISFRGEILCGARKPGNGKWEDGVFYFGLSRANALSRTEWTTPGLDGVHPPLQLRMCTECASRLANEKTDVPSKATCEMFGWTYFGPSERGLY